MAELIAAIDAANPSGTPYTIRLKPGTYNLVEADGDTAFPPITGDITLEGILAGIERVSDAGSFRFLRVEPSGRLTLQGVTLRGGRLGNSGDGGAVYNQGVLTLEGARIVNNHARNGGGIYNDGGSVRIRNATFSDNQAVGSGGGLFMRGGKVTIRDSSFQDNSAEIGGAIDNQGGILTISASRFANNPGTGRAGGINSTGSLSIRSSQLDGSTTGD